LYFIKKKLASKKGKYAGVERALQKNKKMSRIGMKISRN